LRIDKIALVEHTEIVSSREALKCERAKIMKKYTVTEFSNRANRVECTSWAKAAAILRSKGEGYFIQGPKMAWFYSDLLAKEVK
jgi:hypothetical protein